METQIIYKHRKKNLNKHNTLIFSGANNRCTEPRKKHVWQCFTTVWISGSFPDITQQRLFCIFTHSRRMETAATQSRSSQSPTEIALHARRTGNLIFPQETKVLSRGRFHPPGPATPTYSLAWVAEGSSVTSSPCLRAINFCMPAAFFPTLLSFKCNFLYSIAETKLKGEICPGVNNNTPSGDNSPSLDH